MISKKFSHFHRVSYLDIFVLFYFSFDDLDDDDLNKDDDGSDINDIEGGAEEEPLNSEDDVTDEDNADLFETDNVVVCQYDKVKKALDFSDTVITMYIFPIDKSIP